jgi:hypothetical protein
LGDSLWGTHFGGLGLGDSVWETYFGGTRFGGLALGDLLWGTHFGGLALVDSLLITNSSCFITSTNLFYKAFFGGVGGGGIIPEIGGQ